MAAPDTPSAAGEPPVHPPAEAAFMSAAQAPELSLFGFRAAGLALLIAPTTRTEVVPAGKISDVPNGPPWLAGLMNLRGTILPVVDLKRALGFGATLPADARGGAKSMVLTFDKGDRAIGVLIETLPFAVKGLTPAYGLPDLPEPLASCAPAGYRHDGELWIEFPHELFFEALATGVPAV